ncbi:MAG: hypothetical protein IPK80_22305 [Nannocystis sp.]|nr:hypothetical protein [Nannocystis sp.]
MDPNDRRSAGEPALLPSRRLFALALALALVAPAPAPSAGEVRISGEAWRALTDEQPGVATQPRLQPWVERRELTFTRVDSGLELRGVFRLRALQPGWFLGDLLGPEFELLDLRWDRRPAAVSASELGFTVAGYIRDVAVLELRAFLPHSDDQGPRPLQIMGAVHGVITLPDALELDQRAAPAPDARAAADLTAIPHAGAAYFSGAAHLELRRAAPPVIDAEALVLAAVGLGLTVGDAELRGRARLRYQVRRGHIDRLSVRVRGLSGDLELRGAGVRQWQRSGDRLDVELQAPVTDRLDLEIAWTEPVSKATESNLSIPTIEPLGVYRSETALQLARDGEIEVIPALPGWTAVPAAQLPAYSRDLVEGTPTAAYTAGEPRPGRLDLLRFIPAPGPPVLVDVADYTVATSQEGRLLVRALYEVRNERAAHLRITPPPGLTILGARVGADVALPARDRDDPSAWLIPLRRSVETVKGALSFGVEVIFIGESTAWRRRERRRLQLPTLSAPIAVTRLTLHLPPGYTTRLAPGDGDVVTRFDRGEGITYGLGSGDVGVAELDARFQEAVGAWLSNDFDAAQARLDELRQRGARSDNIDRLQANLDVVSGKDGPVGKASQGGEVTVERRIKEQAKARASSDVQQQAELEREAEDLRRRGDYERAEAQYSRSLVIGEKLAKLEQAESVEQSARNVALATEIAETKKKRAKARPKPRATSASRPTKDSGVVLYDFDDDSLEGELARPPLPEAKPSEPLVLAPGLATDTPTDAPRPDQPVPQDTPPANAPRSGSARDFTQVVEVTATTSLERASLRLAGTARARRINLSRRARAGGAAAPRSPRPDNDADGLLDKTDAIPGPGADHDRLPPPQVTASSLSVVIPAAGRAIRYQHLLLAPEAAYIVEIKAHQPLRRRDRERRR